MKKNTTIYNQYLKKTKPFPNSAALILFLIGISFALVYGSSNNNNTFQIFAQPAKDYPIPDSTRMFTNDTAFIKKIDQPPYILDLAMVPKNPMVGKPTLFVLNFLQDSDQNLALAQ